MMGPRLPARTGDEHDAITGWRRVAKRMGRAGVTSRIKRGMRRRERRAGRLAVDPDTVVSEHDGWWCYDPDDDSWAWTMRDEELVSAICRRDRALRVPLSEVAR